jgi:predicted metal-dependent HD superfamily phosphohydrolase
MNFKGVSDFILHKLENELPDNLTYHNVSHTKDVYEAVTRIGTGEKVSKNELELLRVAALFHDSGWAISCENHELKSCEIAREYLPGFGFAPNEIETICKLIMATRLPWSPENHLEKIIIDADLDYLGTDNFFPRAEALRLELKSMGKLPDDIDWNQLQVKFLQMHVYYTPSAINSRAAKKNENLEELKKML